jgi:tetratricopeptide (TPR) repeat protein
VNGGLLGKLVVPGPNMLPEETTLIGRDAELDLLLTTARRRLSRHGPSQPIHVSIVGVAGVGKSALGTTLAHRLRDGYPDGALYLDVLRQPGDSSQHLRMFLEALGRRPSLLPPDANLPAEFVRATNRKRIIVFLDNVINYDDIRDLIPRSASCLVILTSLERLSPDISPLHLEPLQVDHAVELFRAFAPSRPEATGGRDKTLEKVLEACAGLPVAILPLAAGLEDNPTYTLANALEALTTYQYQSVIGPAPEASFRVSYDRLTEQQALLFRRLAVVPGESFDISVAAHLGGGLTQLQARDQLDQLRGRELIQPTQDEKYFAMHSLLRQFAGKLLGAEAPAQIMSLLEFYLHEAEHNDKIIRSLEPASTSTWTGNGNRAVQISRDRDSAMRWMESQHRNLVAAVNLACDQGLSDLAWKISCALVEFFEIRGEWESWEQTHQAAKRSLADQSMTGLAHISYGLGRLYRSRREWSEAIEHYRMAIAAFRQLDLALELGRSLNSLGDVYRYMRNWDAAQNCFTSSLEILQRDHHPREVAIAKRSMAAIHRLRGEFEDAQQLCLQAMRILEDQHDERWIAATRLSLADIYLDSDLDQAQGLLEQCLAVFAMFGDTHWLLLTQRSLGEALRKKRDYAGAMELLRRCQESLRQSRDLHWEGEVLHSIGQVDLDTDLLDEARSNFDEAMKRFKAAGDILWEGRTYVSLGHVAAKKHDAQEAAALFHRAWPLLVEQGASADLAKLDDDMTALQYEPHTERQTKHPRDLPSGSAVRDTT